MNPDDYIKGLTRIGDLKVTVDFSKNDTLLDFPCDTCGARATSLARDVVRSLSESGEYYVYEYAEGPMKCGCEQHPVKSVEYDREGNDVTFKEHQ